MMIRILSGVALVLFGLLVGCSAPDDGAAAPGGDPTETGVDAADVASAPTGDPVAIGKRVHQEMGCAACHSVDGSKMTAGTYKGIYGTEVELADGKTVVRDEAYLRKAIVAPAEQIVKGYQDLMVSYEESLTPEEIDGVIAYIKSLGEGAPSAE